jgi:hypothetical protein
MESAVRNGVSLDVRRTAKNTLIMEPEEGVPPTVPMLDSRPQQRSSAFLSGARNVPLTMYDSELMQPAPRVVPPTIVTTSSGPPTLFDDGPPPSTKRSSDLPPPPSPKR